MIRASVQAHIDIQIAIAVHVSCSHGVATAGSPRESLRVHSCESALIP